MVLFERFENDGVPSILLSPKQREIVEKIKKKIKTSEYKFRYINKCPLCGGSEFENISRKDRYGFELNINICKSCGLVFANPYYDEKTLKMFYENDYRMLYSSNVSLNNFFRLQVSHGKKIYKFISKIMEIKRCNVVEIGAGAGGILFYFKEMGNFTYGVDYDKKYIKYGRRYGVEINYGDIKDVIDNKIKADILIYSHVIEHIPNINKELELTKKVLKPNGILYIELPGIRRLHKSYGVDFLRMVQNAHIYYFTLVTLSNILAKHGYKLIIGNEKIQSIFKRSKSKINFKNDYYDIINYLRSVEEYRSRLNFYIFREKLIEHIIRLKYIIGENYERNKSGK